MITEEFSNEFDILYNNISSNQAPGLDEYEKSVFLTQAQEALVIDLYRGTLGDSFESTEEVTRYLNSLVMSAGPYKVDTGIATCGCKRFEVSPQNKILFIVFESAYTTKGQNDRDVLVERATHDTLIKDLKNPFRRPNDNKVLSTSESNKIFLYTKEDIESVSYSIKYIAVPSPIILTDLDSISTELSIRGENKKRECSLHPALHMPILVRAVQMAKAAMGIIETQN